MSAKHLLEAIRPIMVNAPRIDLMDRRVLVANLIFLFHTIRASEDLLTLASGWADGELKEYYLKHLEEERGHAEWLKRDLASVGVDALATPIPRQAVELVGSQLYLMRYLNPCALLGYMAVLECFPAPAFVVDELEAEHGTDLLRTMRFHAEHDIDHGPDVLEAVNKLSPEERAIAIESGRQTALYFADAMRAIAQLNEASNG